MADKPSTMLDEQIREVQNDIDGIKRLIDQTDRPRIKQNLEVQQRKFEQELTQLQDKLQKQQQQQQQAAAPTEEKTASTPSYTKDISVYAWDQTDKFVKVYVQNLDGVGNLPEGQVQCSFETHGFHLQIHNLKNVSYSLKRTRLLHDIQPDQSTFKVKKDMVILSLRKADSQTWECFLQDEKKTPMKPLPNLDRSGKSNETFMNAVEEMYEKGDDATKRAIAQAWVKSQDKMNAMRNMPPDDPQSGIVRTPEFTFYPPPRK